MLLAQAMLLPSLPGQRGGCGGQLLSTLGMPLARTGFAAAALVAGGHFAAFTYLEPLLSSGSGMSGVAITLLLAAYGFAGVGGTWIGQRLASRDVRLTFAGVALLLPASIGMLALAGRHAAVTTVAVALWGEAFGAFPVCVQLWLHRLAPAAFESGSALTVTVFQFTVAAGAFARGRIVDGSGVSTAFAIGGTVAAIAAPALLSARFRRARE